MALVASLLVLGLFYLYFENSLQARSNPNRQLQVAPGTELVLKRSGNGHYIFPGTINGQPVTFLLDTGATLVALTASTARRAGIVLSPADYRAEVDTANGRTRAAVVRIDRLEIGRIALDGVEAVVLDDKALGGNLIGMSFLKRLDKYQVENGALLLVQ